MEIIGLDLHKRETQLCRQQPDGRIVDERIPTSRVRFTQTFGGVAPARILLEASTESEPARRASGSRRISSGSATR